MNHNVIFHNCHCIIGRPMIKLTLRLIIIKAIIMMTILINLHWTKMAKMSQYRCCCSFLQTQPLNILSGHRQPVTLLDMQGFNAIWRFSYPDFGSFFSFLLRQRSSQFSSVPVHSPQTLNAALIWLPLSLSSLLNDKYLNKVSTIFSNKKTIKKLSHTYCEVSVLAVNWTEAEHCYVYSIKPGLYSTVIDTLTW